MRRMVVLTLLLAGVVAAQEGEVTFRADTRLVEAYATVFDKHGNPLPNLTGDRFRLLDAGQPEKIVAFEGADEPLSCALLLDVTGSMQKFLPTLRLSVMHFVDEMRDSESLAVYTFTTMLKVNQPFTTDRKLVKQAIMRTSAGGGTALFDSVSKVAHDLEQRKGKKALVVFTDGDDNSSTLSATAASRQARRSGVPLYVVAQGEALHQPALLKALEGLASDTGGITFRLSRPEKVGEVFAEISRNLQHTYLLAWKPPEHAGASWRPIKVTIAGAEDAQIRVRQGYWPD